SVNFQIGIDGDDGLNVGLTNSSSSSLGLSGSVGVQTFTSERVTAGNNNAIVEADIKLNGENMLTAQVADQSTTRTAAAAYATAINLN
mgnify:CR=1